MTIADLRVVSVAIREAALAAADPRQAVVRALAAAPPPASARLLAIAVGKASAGMMTGALDVLGSRVTRGLCVIPHGYPPPEGIDRRIRVISAAHPVPDDGSAAAAAETSRMVEEMSGDEVCLFLVSGGGSSLLSCPVPPLVLSDLTETNRLLLASGADIQELNTVRKHMSPIAGGRLAETSRGTLLTLAVSDVVGDDLAVIASGPTVADTSTFADAAAVLRRYGLQDRVPPAVRLLIQRGLEGAIPETPKKVAPRHTAMVIASGLIAVEAAAEAARLRGFAPHVLTASLRGEARDAGAALAAAALEVRRGGTPLDAPACLIAAGETTVTVRGTGTGGRNQEIALSAAISLAGQEGILLTSFATDGIEGNSDAAGACSSGDTIEAGRRAGLDARACLAANDSHRFLEAAGELIVTGPTGTNVNDITFILITGGQPVSRAAPGPHKSRFDQIYNAKAGLYHELVMREDKDGRLPAALKDLVDWAGKTVVELGAGTGRVTRIISALAGKVLAFDRSPHMIETARAFLAGEGRRNVSLAVAESDAVPLAGATADVVIEGWSFGHTVSGTAEGWQERAAALIAETMRLLKPGATVVLIETLGTGVRTPTPPGTVLPRFYEWLEKEQGFAARGLRTDYLFESLEKARELVEFFFGAMVDHEVLANGTVVVPECTGVWWRRKG